MQHKIELSAIDWPETLQRFGVDARFLVKKQGPCPMHPDHGRTKFRFDNKGGQGTWICNDCGAGGGFGLLRRFTGLPDREIFRKIEELQMTGQTRPVYRRKPAPWCADDLSEDEKSARKLRLQKAWQRAIPVRENSPVWRYLLRRVPGLRLEWLSTFIRASAMVYFDEDGKDRGTFPVMLSKAAWHDTARRVAVTLHRTYLTPDGNKAPFDKVKKQMASHVKLDGASIRVNTAPDRCEIFVCEGIETGLAIVAMTENRFPVYAALNASNLAAFRAPVFAARVIICADHDAPNSRGERIGILDARKLEARLMADGKKAQVRYPDVEGRDWNDHYVQEWLPRKDRPSAQMRNTVPAGPTAHRLAA